MVVVACGNHGSFLKPDKKVLKLLHDVPLKCFKTTSKGQPAHPLYQPKDDVVRARVSTQLKHNAEAVLSEIGMSMGEAIRLFLTQVSLRHEFPVELKVPNKTTLKAMSDKPTDDIYQNVDDLFDEVSRDA